MKHLDPETLVVEAPKVEIMTRQQRLLHWAKLVAEHKVGLFMFHGLEFRSDLELAKIEPRPLIARSGLFASYFPSRRETVFSVALEDKTLNEHGLHQGGNLLDVMKFMEISRHEMHEFSCDCGGDIPNQRMASRIMSLA